MFGHARWVLSKTYPKFIETAPEWATRAASVVSIAACDRPLPRKEIRIDVHLPDGRDLVMINDETTLQDWRTQRHLDDDDNVLKSFAEHLGKCSFEVFGEVVSTAVAHETGTGVWKRILGVGSDRIEDVADLLWPIATSMPFLDTRDTCRDTVTCIAAAYPTRSEHARAEFEEAMLAWLSEPIEDKTWRENGVYRLLSLVSSEHLVTEAARDLRNRLSDAGELRGNRPYMTVTSGMLPNDDIVDRLLENEGATPSKGVDGAVRAVARPLEDALKSAEEDDTRRVAALWALLCPLRDRLDRAETEGAHADVLRSGWAAIGEALTEIMESEALALETNDQPSLVEIVDLIDRLAASPWPDPAEETEGSMMAWGNWDIRVYAAKALIILCRRFGGSEPSLLDRLDALTFDAVPSVRLQITSSLNTLWDVAPDKMWKLVEKIGREEAHRSLIGYFIGGSLARLSEVATDRVEAVLSGILARVPLRKGDTVAPSRDEMVNAVANIAAHLWVGRARPAAKAWIDAWLSDPTGYDSCLRELTSDLREALFDRYMHPEAPPAAKIQARAKGIIDRLVEASAQEMEQARAESETVPAQSRDEEPAAARLSSAAGLIDHAMAQIYFGSGAFERRSRDRDTPGLADNAAKRAFLNEYRDTLKAIAQAGPASALHHLAELYAFLVPANPAEVFDRWSELLVVEGSLRGYEFEQLASAESVRLVRLYLADHRDVFTDPARRDRLVQVLNLFSDAGWPEALQLLYELPDLLR